LLGNSPLDSTSGKGQNDGKAALKCRVVTHLAHRRRASTTVIELNRQAYEELKTEKHLEIVPGATYLFEEAGTLQEVARLAGQWFGRYLGQKREV